MHEVVINRPNLAVIHPRDNELIDRDINILTKTISNRRHNNALVYKTLIEDENNLFDFVTYYKNLQFKNVGKSLEVRSSEYEFRMHKNAVMQLATKFNINGRHIGNLLKDGSDWATDVLAYTFNKYTANTRTNDVGLVRAVGTDGGEVRGILSDSYHRYSTGYVYNNLLKSHATDAIVLKTQYDGLSSYIELISKDMKSFYVDGKLVNMVFGLQIRNSSFGVAALDVRPFSFKVACSNGLVTKSTMRSIHKGSKRSSYGFLSNDTLIAEAELNNRYVRDAANYIFSDEQVQKQVDALTMLGNEKVDDKQLKQLPKLGITQNELSEITDIILGGKQEDGLLGNNSAYDAIQAITRIAQDKPLVREKELQEIAGSFIDSVIATRK
jgi:hypothetical protein